jgi:thiamine pyrophosphate-dependent acetolactate synthase large subunit-like protein
MTRPRVHAALAESLAALGTDTLFGVVGSGNFRLVEHLTARFGAAYWWARHETAAVTMADAWARVTGRTGVCTVHQGPGLTNALTGLAEAVKARTPMLVLAGDTATTAVSVNQDVDQDRLARAVGAGAERIRSAETAVRDLVRALAGGQVERRPVVLSLPIDLQELECAPANAAALLPPRSTPTRPAEAATRRVADLVEQARRPLVVGGRGAVLAGARAPLEAVADRIGALLATSAPANGLFAGNPLLARHLRRLRDACCVRADRASRPHPCLRREPEPLDDPPRRPARARRSHRPERPQAECDRRPRPGRGGAAGRCGGGRASARRGARPPRRAHAGLSR